MISVQEMMRTWFLSALLLAGAAAANATSIGTLYGGNGGHTPSINDGALITIDQNTGAPTLVGTPAGVARLTGLAFDSSGNLWGSTQTGGGFPPPPPVLTSDLIRINPATGALINDVGTIRESSTSGPALSIADLTLQPGTGALYGVDGPNDGLGLQGDLFTINPSTGVATLVGNTGYFFASIAFGPDGTLYLTGADFAGAGPINPVLATINPSTGAVLTHVSTTDFFGGLGVRSDGTIFGSTGDTAQIFTLSTSGAETLVGSTGQNFVGDLAFAPVPEPGTLALLLCGGVAVLGGRFMTGRRRRRRIPAN